jgi:Leucine-rich repeat (LRR) protein
MSLTSYDIPGSTCSICMKTMIPSQSALTVGICGHTFHTHCFKQDQEDTRTCAKCEQTKLKMSLTPYDVPGSMCPICMEAMIPFQSALTVGICGHTFHTNCLQQVPDVFTCAKCRQTFNVKPHDYDNGEEDFYDDYTDDEEYDECLTIHNAQAIIHHPDPKSVKSIKFVHASVIPPSVRRMINLEQVFVRGDYNFDDGNDTDLSDASIDSLSECKSITFIKCHGLYMHAISPTISALTQLAHLTIDGCDISTLPDVLGEMTQLKTLGLGCNRISVFPPSMKNLVHLTHVNLSHNPIDEVPDFLQNATQLQSLAVVRTKIRNIPLWIEDFRQLSTLKVQLCQHLESVTLSKPVLWTELSLDGTRITDFAFFRYTPLLTTLDLSCMKTRLLQLPDEMQGLTKLTKLTCQTNYLTTFPETLATAWAPTLRFLDLTYNRFSGVLPSSLFLLTHLEELRLGMNQIESITTDPDSVLKLESLRVLVINSTGSDVMHFFPNLDAFDLERCPSPVQLNMATVANGTHNDDSGDSDINDDSQCYNSRCPCHLDSRSDSTASDCDESI